MCKCPKCGARLNIGNVKHNTRRDGKTWRAQSTAAQWTGNNAGDLTRQPDPNRIIPQPGNFDEYRETPVRAPDPIADVVVPGLMTGVAALVATVDAAVLMLNVHFNQWPVKMIESLASGPPAPTFAFGSFNPALALLAVPCVAATLAWAHYTNILRPTLWKLEEWAHRDLGGDGDVGEPEPEQNEQESYAPPLKTSGRIKNTAVARAPNINERHITIRPEDGDEKKVTTALGDLLHFASISFATGDWSRDKWASEMLPHHPRKMGQRLWADYKAFFESYDWWRTTDFTVFAQMDTVLRQTVTNER